MKILGIGILLLASTLVLGQAVPDKKIDTPALSSASKPDTSATIRARLKGYKLQQKAATELAKAQTKQQLAQLKLQAAVAKAEHLAVVAQAKNSR